jgi:hypothetical protein
MNVTARLCEYCKQASQGLTILADLVVGKGKTIVLRGRHEPIEVHAIRQTAQGMTLATSVSAG